MSTQDNGGPAFPRRLPNVTVPPDEAMQIIRAHEGMSLRDYFAATAPGAPPWIARRAREAEALSESAELLADWAYEYADAMLKARSK